MGCKGGALEVTEWERVGRGKRGTNGAQDAVSRQVGFRAVYVSNEIVLATVTGRQASGSE